MAEFLFNLDAWLTGLGFAAMTAVGWAGGLWLGRRSRRAGAPAEKGVFDDAILAVLGLLLAFCFAASAAKMDARKKLVVDEATAIADFAGTASLLTEPHRGALLDTVRRYVDLRVEFGQLRLDDPRMPALRRETHDQQRRMTELVAEIIQSKETPTIHAPLVQTLNALTTAHDARRAGLSDHVPGTILLLLALSALGGAILVGRHQGVTDRRDRVSVALFITLVSLIVFTTIDLQQPRRGLVRVPQTAMVELRASLAGEP